MLVIVAGIFIVCALLASMVIPAMRRTSRASSVGWFIFGAVILFAAMLTSVVLATGGEEGEHEAAVATETQPGETTAPATTGESDTGDDRGDDDRARPRPRRPPPVVRPQATRPPARPSSSPPGVPAVTRCGPPARTATSGRTSTMSKPSADKVVERVSEGKGVMPSFKGQLSAEQIQDVAAFVSTSTRGE